MGNERTFSKGGRSELFMIMIIIEMRGFHLTQFSADLYFDTAATIVVNVRYFFSFLRKLQTNHLSQKKWFANSKGWLIWGSNNSRLGRRAPLPLVPITVSLINNWRLLYLSRIKTSLIWTPRSHLFELYSPLKDVRIKSDKDMDLVVYWQ